MPTFLGIVQNTRQACSVAGNGPTAVTGQINEYARLIEYVQLAHEEIQSKWYDWNYLWADGGFDTIADQGSYSLADPSSMGGSGNTISDFSRLAKFDPASGRTGDKIWIGGDTQLQFIPWSSYDPSAYPASGKPSAYTIKPNNAITLLPAPDAVYPITFEYYRTPVKLVDNDDVSPIPERYHRVIVARAMILYGNYESAPEVKTDGMERYQEAMDQLEADQLPSYSGYRFAANNDIQVVVCE